MAQIVQTDAPSAEYRPSEHEEQLVEAEEPVEAVNCPAAREQMVQLKDVAKRKDLAKLMVLFSRVGHTCLQRSLNRERSHRHFDKFLQDRKNNLSLLKQLGDSLLGMRHSLQS